MCAEAAVRVCGGGGARARRRRCVCAEAAVRVCGGEEGGADASQKGSSKGDRRSRSSGVVTQARRARERLCVCCARARERLCLCVCARARKRGGVRGGRGRDGRVRRAATSSKMGLLWVGEGGTKGTDDDTREATML